MKSLNQKLLLATLMLGVISTAPPVMAQMGKVEVDKPEFNELTSPDFNVGTGKKKFKPKEWLEVEVKFKVLEVADKAQDKFADRVTVKWYVAAKINDGGSTEVRVMEKTVNYVNVPVGEDIYTSVYLPPSAVMRISGGDRASKRMIEGVGGEIMVNGLAAYKNAGFFTTLSKSKGKWWDKVARYDKISLLNKSETPFKFLWWDRYAEIDEDRR